MMRKFLFFLARILTQIFLECIIKVMQIYSRWLIQDAVLTTHEAPSIPAQCSLQSCILFPVALFSSHVHLLRITFTSSMFRFFVIACSQKLRRKMESVLSSPKYEFAGAPNDNFWKISVWKTI